MLYKGAVTKITESGNINLVGVFLKPEEYRLKHPNIRKVRIDFAE